MRRVSLFLTILLAGCGAVATPPAIEAPVPATGPACPPPTPQAGPVAVVRTESAPPPLGPSLAPRPTALPSCGPCAPVGGRVYDGEGRPVTEALEVLAEPADRTIAPAVVGRVVDGVLTAKLPAIGQSLIVSVRGPGFASRERAWPPRPNAVGVSELNFGGPATDADPDAPAYFLPPTGADGALVLPSPYPRANGEVTTFSQGQDLIQPMGLALAPGGGLLVTDAQHHAIMTVRPDGAVRILAGRGYQEFFPPGDTLVDGVRDLARFMEPSGIAVGPDGTAYVADMRNHAIRAVAPDGTVTTVAGSTAEGAQDGRGAQAGFREPVGVAVDDDGNVYVVDRGVPRVRMIDRSGLVTTFAGGEVGGYANGTATKARFGLLVAIAIGPDGAIYVADDGNHRLRKITRGGGEVSDVYGAPANRADGAVEVPSIDGFMNLAVDARGALYTAAQGNLYRIDPDGRATVLAGSGLFGHVDGASEVARLTMSPGIAVDAAGVVYFTDIDGRRVRRFVPSGNGR